jgi:hypothetical protein
MRELAKRQLPLSRRQLRFATGEERLGHRRDVRRTQLVIDELAARCTEIGEIGGEIGPGRSPVKKIELTPISLQKNRTDTNFRH